MAVAFFAAGLFAGDFLTADFLTGDFFAADLLTRVFFAVDLLTVDRFTPGFRAADFFAADFRARDFFAVERLRFAARLIVGLLALDRRAPARFFAAFLAPLRARFALLLRPPDFLVAMHVLRPGG